MSYTWTRMRLPLAIIAVLIMTIALARLFSGPEDGWVRNDSGEWVAHGEPSGPPPSEYYQETPMHIFVPVAFLIAFAAPLFLLRFYKSRDRLNYNAASRDQKLYGYLGTALILFGLLSGAALIVEVGITLDQTVDPEIVTLLVVAAMIVFALICGVLGVLLFSLKRICDDHFQIMKVQRELSEKIALLGRSSQA